MGIKDINMGENKLPIMEFKLENLCDHAAMVMVAKRGSGKSVVCRALLHHYRSIPVGLIIAPTDRMNSFYGDFFPSSYIHYDYKSEIIEKLLARQKMIIKINKEKNAVGKKVDTRAFIIMDDCLSKKGSWMKDQPILELLFNGRHYHLMYILTMQYPLGIGPELRNNFDYIFLLAEDFYSNKKRIYDHYAGMFKNFDSFQEVFQQLTDDFGCMVIVNRGKRKGFSDKVFWYKAPLLEGVKFEIGCKQFLEYHKRNYDEHYEDKKNAFDFDEYFTKKKKNKSMIKVDKVEKNSTIPQKKRY